jgi:Ca-activated chloride channel family protein
MRNIRLRLTSIAVLLAFSVTILGQGRPRRVGTQTNTPPPPPDTRQAPVLGGSNNPNNSRPSTQSNQEPTGPQEVDAGDVIKVNTTLVTVPVSVMDRDGRYVPNLNKEDFRVWEDGVEQQVAFFASVDKPFSVVLMLDTSPSTQFRLEDIQDAAITSVNQLRPDDKVMVVSFNDDIKMLSDFTSDRFKLQRAIERAHTGDGTRLYDAVDVVINQRLNRIQGRKAIVLFTDGVDTTSKRASYESNVTDAQELDALIYPVQYDTSRDVNNGGMGYPSGGQIDVWGQILGGIFGGGGGTGRGGRRGGGGYPSPGGRGGRQSDYSIGGQYLREMAESSGGRTYQADSLQNMSSAFGNVAEELRRQYTIGYYPKRSPQPGQRRQIKVRANEPNLAVRARDSYIFNPNGTAVVDDSARTNAPVLKKLVDRRTF